MSSSSLSSVSTGQGQMAAAVAVPAVAVPVAAPPPAPILEEPSEASEEGGGATAVADETMDEPVPGPSGLQASSALQSRMTNGTPSASAPPTPEPPVLPSTSTAPATSTASSASSSSFLPPSSVVPPPSVTEDGYLGDCSSDGGNEKNFPMPPEKLKRLLLKNGSSSAGHLSGSENGANDAVDPPAGLAFQNIQPDLLGYQVLPEPVSGGGGGGGGCAVAGSSRGRGGGGSSRKMRSFLRSKLSNHNHSWSAMKATLAEKKLRISANLNNLEAVERLLGGGANPNSIDEHRRTALHFSAAKGYDGVVRVLLQNGADPNQKDALGNTALHLAACTNHIGVVTLLLRAGTDVSQLDNNGRTPMQLAQSKLKMLQRRKKEDQEGATEMVKVLLFTYSKSCLILIT